MNDWKDTANMYDHNFFTGGLKRKNIDVKLYLTNREGELKFLEIDLIKDLPVYTTKNCDLIMQSVLTSLKRRGYNTEEVRIQFYSDAFGCFVDCGYEPVSQSCLVKEIDLLDNLLHLEVEIEPSDHEISNTNFKSTISSAITNPELKLVEIKSEKSSEGLKDNTIGSVVEIVKKWRELYEGYIIPEGMKIKYSLDKAAEILGIQKKTLDDYLQQIKKAAAYGFDFEQHKDKQIGYLRNFVKEKEQVLNIVENGLPRQM